MKLAFKAIKDFSIKFLNLAIWVLRVYKSF